MVFSSCLQNIKNFLSNQQQADARGVFRVTVVDFEDRSNLDCGAKFAELLKQNQLLAVNFFKEPFNKNFLNLQGRNFFDFIDRGTQILASTQADILIWGYEENGKIRLNFQIPEQYNIPNVLSFSLLDSLFIPLNYFTDTKNFSASLLLLIYGIIIAAITPATNEQKEYKPKLLQEIVELLARDTSQKDISREFMPYIMNMLGKIYLYKIKTDFNKQDMQIIADLFEGALKNKQYMRLPIYYGCVYNNLGQLYEKAYIADEKYSFASLKASISYYQEAKKYLNRNYPYDYGLICYHLAVLYFDFWRNTNDIQALRDAVSQLRETEKVYSFAQFAKSWCHIEGLLGQYLTALGMTTGSTEIMQLAIGSYKNQQKFYEQKIYPVEWAQIQNEIGNIYYLLGKQNEDENFMLEAKNYFNSALDIYNQLKCRAAIAETKKQLAKVANYID